MRRTGAFVDNLVGNNKEISSFLEVVSDGSDKNIEIARPWGLVELFVAEGPVLGFLLLGCFDLYRNRCLSVRRNCDYVNPPSYFEMSQPELCHATPIGRRSDVSHID